MENNIIQGSEQWKEARQSKIGGSEVFSLCHHYCARELQEMGFDLSKERPFRTIQEMFLKIKFGAKLSEIDPVHSEFGNGLEAYTAYCLKQELPELEIERTKEFVLNPEFHELASCSPDGYITMNDSTLPDFDKTCLIEQTWGRGMLELKTANYFANFEQGGSRLQYLMQLCYNMMVADCKWGALAVLMPKEKQFDEPFFKGQILERLKWTDGLPYFKETHEDNINNFYDLKYYIYPELPAFQQMIIKSLNAFQADLDAYDTDQSRFPRNSEDLAGLQREKAMWAQLWPEHYGKKQLDEEDELNKLLNDKYQAQVEKMFAEQAHELLTNQILQKVKSEGLDKFVEIVGTENRLSFIKNGQTRFYKINNKKEQK